MTLFSNRKYIYFYDLISILTKKEIKVRYKNSVFGYLWSLGNPLCFAFIYYLAFKMFMKINLDNYTVFLICGLFPWQWLSSSIIGNLYIYNANSQIIKKTNFPRSVLPLSNILMEGFNFLVSIPVIVLFLYLYNIDLHIKMLILWVPILAIIQLCMAYGFSLILSTINLFFRDVERFVNLGLMMVFYATPILYSSEMIPSKYKWVLSINPFSQIIISWRDLILNGTVNFLYIFNSIVISTVSLVLGFLIFNKLKYRFAEVL